MTAARGLGYRILLPVFLLVGILTAALLFLAGRVTDQVREDYHRFTLTASTSHVATALELAVAELTAARLHGNPVVLAAKQGAVREAIAGIWAENRHAGVIAGPAGELVFTTLDGEATRAVLARGGTGDHELVVGGRRLHCFSQPFAPWGWSVTTVAPHEALAIPGERSVYLLLPLASFGAALLAAGLLWILGLNLQRPVAALVAAVEAGQDAPATGIAELDRIGGSVNAAFARLRERSAQLTAELAQRRHAEAAVRAKEEQVRLLLDSTAEGIYGVDTAGVCTFVNPACLRLTGHVREGELLGKNVHQLIHHTRPDGRPYPEHECRILEAYRAGRGVHVDDEVFWRADGTSFPAEYWSYPIVDDGAIKGAVVTFVDTTERTALEQQLRQAQKMEAVGRLAGGIAHDFNNMLMAIVGFGSLARDLTEEGTKARHYAEQVLAAADKATGLTRQILAFSRKQVMKPEPADLNGVVLGLGKILSRLLGEDVEVSLSLAAGELVALVDRGQIEQVLMNLATNARDAMPRGGRLSIGTRAVEIDAAGAAVHGLEQPGRYALVTVSDTGTGMDERTRQRLFEPFFTTKEKGKGTGLGLSIVYGVVKQHRGQIGVYSEPGRGTTFRIYLPLAAAAAAGAAVAPPPPAPPRGGSETILVAEDDDTVRALATNVLEGAGYRVVATRDGEEAVREFLAHREEVALCLLDVVMPRMSGKDALDRIREARPGARAIFMSGYAADILGGSAPAGPGLAYLDKPLLPRELLRAVRESLDS